MKTDWKDDVFEQRKYKMTNNSDGTVSLEDATVYSQQGDAFGAKELNAIGEELNALASDVTATKKSVSDGKTLIAAAITLKKVTTAATDSFATMAANISKIVLGSGNATTADVVKGKTFTNDDGKEYTGTLTDNSGQTKMGTVSLDADNSRVQLAIPEEAKYDTKSKVYTAYLTLANLIGLNASILKRGVSILGITGAWEGYIKDNNTKIYHNGTNYDGYAEESDHVRDGYYSVTGYWTITTTKKYDCDRANGVLVKCHKDSGESSSVEVSVYDSVAKQWQKVASQSVTTPKSDTPEDYLFDLSCRSGNLKLKIQLHNVNVTSMRMYGD